ncbi:DUF3040 domain-containing protein [Bailinhaonella thermotolerans]|uniref:DUF3040 domain-containing protein n=1 Tax=Bailinhaonella thermotolerans TaxID=1070861 RepID=A0A3A4A3M2_9ACTN|nr:DUF3040 domain-containing protein [Bailinhaonella thermotolerans]RJL23055.1 DUF3040 domain-containing protein [Bailinhaonella thermotolerans]
MTWSQDEQRRLLAEIEEHLLRDDPRLAARLESFNARVERRGRPMSRRGVVLLTVTWLLVTALVVALIVIALNHPAALPPTTPTAVP